MTCEKVVDGTTIVFLNVVTFYSVYNTMLSIVTIGCDLCSDGIIIIV